MDRIKKVQPPAEKVSFKEWNQTVGFHFPELTFAAEIGLSIIAQVLIKDITNPFALVLVDVPSSGKTITINFFAGIDGLTYASDKFTPASFVSNSAAVKAEKLVEVDLLPRIKHKMFLIRDLATLFSKRDDDLNESLGILTRVLDGEGLSTDTGMHGQRGYVGDYLFMILAGSTPIPPRVWKMMGSLGSRLFFLHMNTKEKNEEELADQITYTSHKDREQKCREITKNFLLSLWTQNPEGVEWDKTKDPQTAKLIVSRCAMLLAKLRGVINVWRPNEDADYEFTIPIIEKPDRINQLFYNLCRGHALVQGRTTINEADLKLIVELAIDSAPNTRSKLFRVLLDSDGFITTSQVMNSLNCSRKTALKEMEILKILGICQYFENPSKEPGTSEQMLKLVEKFDWFLGEDCKAIRNWEASGTQGQIM